MKCSLTSSEFICGTTMETLLQCPSQEFATPSAKKNVIGGVTFWTISHIGVTKKAELKILKCFLNPLKIIISGFIYEGIS